MPMAEVGGRIRRPWVVQLSGQDDRPVARLGIRRRQPRARPRPRAGPSPTIRNCSGMPPAAISPTASQAARMPSSFSSGASRVTATSSGTAASRPQIRAERPRAEVRGVRVHIHRRLDQRHLRVALRLGAEPDVVGAHDQRHRVRQERGDGHRVDRAHHGQAEPKPRPGECLHPRRPLVAVNDVELLLPDQPRQVRRGARRGTPVGLAGRAGCGSGRVAAPISTSGPGRLITADVVTAVAQRPGGLHGIELAPADLHRVRVDQDFHSGLLTDSRRGRISHEATEEASAILPQANIPRRSGAGPRSTLAGAPGPSHIRPARALWSPLTVAASPVTAAS